MQATLSPTDEPALDEIDCPIEVSVVMPCLNEARTVGRCVDKAFQALRQMGVKGEVIVADNGSMDGSQALARLQGARVIHAEEKGYGAALQAGIAAARGQYVIMGDADDSYDFSRLEPFVERLRGGYDLVMGNRFQGGILPGAMPWLHRYVGNPVLTGILNLFFHSGIRDAHCGLRAFRKDAYKDLDLRTPGMEFASEMVVKACLKQKKITEVPIVLHPDGRDRPPHLRSFRDGWRHLRFLLLLCPLWLYLIPACLLVGTGFGLLARATPGQQEMGSFVLSVHTQLLGCLGVVVGYQAVWFWAFARVHGRASGLVPADSESNRRFDSPSLERGLIFGALLVLLGLGLNSWQAYYWYNCTLAPVEFEATLRWVLWGGLTMVLGAQTILGSFFLSMLCMKTGR
jgi:hypothetical protein